MRFLVLACSLSLLAPAAVPAADFTRDLQSALGPYYAALVASSRRNTDQTQRQIVLFSSRWDRLMREADAAPSALRSDSQWLAFLRHVGDALQKARDSCRRGNLLAAHAQLESIRLQLRQIDARHNLLPLDDGLTDFHDAMQRMIGHVGGVNEIVLRPKDFDDIGEDYQAARDAWQSIESAPGAPGQSPGWRSAADEIARTLDEIGRQLRVRQAEPLAGTIQGLEDKYYSLLLALSRARA